MSDSNTSTDASAKATLTDQAKAAANIVAGHGQYLQGAAESAIGATTGSSSWTQAGEDIKQDAAAYIRESVSNAPEGGKVGQLAEEACPQTGDGVGDDPRK